MSWSSLVRGLSPSNLLYHSWPTHHRLEDSSLPIPSAGALTWPWQEILAPQEPYTCPPPLSLPLPTLVVRRFGCGIRVAVEFPSCHEACRGRTIICRRCDWFLCGWAGGAERCEKEDDHKYGTGHVTKLRTKMRVRTRTRSRPSTRDGRIPTGSNRPPPKRLN